MPWDVKLRDTGTFSSSFKIGTSADESFEAQKIDLIKKNDTFCSRDQNENLTQTVRNTNTWKSNVYEDPISENR